MLNRCLRLALSCLFVLLLSFPSWSQDVERIADNLKNIKDQSLSITGGLRLGVNSYGASGIAPRRDAFQWNANASLTLGFLGISAPFNFAFSDKNQNFNLPSYTFAGISPTYKWLTLHGGDRSLSFSRYTMDGITFRGGGAEIRPGKFYAGGFFGQLNRALLNDLNAVGNLNGFYQRKAYGGKVGFEGEKGSIGLVLFSATDDEGDNPQTGENQVVTPLDNKVVSIVGRRQLGKRLTFSFEAAHSITNEDKTAPQIDPNERGITNELFGLFNPNQSVSSGQAYHLDAFYNLDKMGLRAGYERVQRGFKTLGALFFNNDSERITAGANRSFMENKLSISVNGGLERTNLEAIEGETTDRLVASVTANYQPSSKWLFNTGYNNFRNDTKLRGRADPNNPIDSIFLAQVTESVNGMILRQLGKETSPSTISLVANYQQANSIINETVNPDNNTRFTNLALNFASGTPSFQYFLGAAANFTSLGDIRTRALSPTAGLTKTFWNNALSTQLRSSLSFVSSPSGDMDNNVFNLSLGLNYRLKNSHSLNISGVHLNRFGAIQDSRNFREYYGTIGYSYRFGGKIGGRNGAP